MISETLEEDKRRNSKALNVLVRGLEMGDTPMSDAEALFTKMGINFTCESARRVDKVELPNCPLVMKLRTATNISTLLSMRAVLKGTKIYLDDDLTLLQQERKREGLKKVMAAREAGKWAIY